MIKYDINGDIIPGKSVGEFYIGCSKSDFELQNLIERDTSNKWMPENVVHEANGNIVVCFNEDNIIEEIFVKNNYKGKVCDLFGIGDRLIDLKDPIEYETSIYDGEGYVYFPEYKGVRILHENYNSQKFSPDIPIEVINIYMIEDN